MPSARNPGLVFAARKARVQPGSQHVGDYLDKAGVEDSDAVRVSSCSSFRNPTSSLPWGAIFEKTFRGGSLQYDVGHDSRADSDKLRHLSE